MRLASVLYVMRSWLDRGRVFIDANGASCQVFQNRPRIRSFQDQMAS